MLGCHLHTTDTRILQIATKLCMLTSLKLHEGSQLLQVHTWTLLSPKSVEEKSLIPPQVTLLYLLDSLHMWLTKLYGLCFHYKVEKWEPKLGLGQKICKPHEPWVFGLVKNQLQVHISLDVFRDLVSKLHLVSHPSPWIWGGLLVLVIISPLGFGL